MIDTVKLTENYIEIIDQTRLPEKFVMVRIRTVPDMVSAIRSLAVRGAPAIGVAAAFSLALFLRKLKTRTNEKMTAYWSAAVKALNASRPTAVNLFSATRRMDRVFLTNLDKDPHTIREAVWREAKSIHQEDLDMSRRIGETGNKLIRNGDIVLTHCNAGGLATAGLGTALAVLYAAKQDGKLFKVFADETRPLLQGSRLTVWELMHNDIDVRLICDNMAAFAMRTKGITKIITGADRIARNGDTANKIGTCGLAILAKHCGVPLYIAAPATTFDLSLDDGSGIPVEERDPEELTFFNGRRIAPSGAKVWNPAFDVTPGGLIAGFITDRGLITPPYRTGIQRKMSARVR